jgi:hypothetical protein
MGTRGLLLVCLLLAIVGWFAMGYFTYQYPPDALNRWIGLALLWPTLVASFVPLIHAVHSRRGDESEIATRATRQSVFAATYVTLCLWLRMIQALNWANGLLMLLLFVATEALLSGRPTEA